MRACSRESLNDELRIENTRSAAADEGPGTRSGGSGGSGCTRG